MASEKSPISLLQELAQIKRIPLPMYSYDVIPLEKTFRVTLKLGQNDEVFAEGVDINKKVAKQLCAENALKLLNIKNVYASPNSKLSYTNVNKPFSNNGTTNTSSMLEKSCGSINLDSPFNNYVGKLNEILSKRSLQYATYRDCGSSNGQFIIECQIFDNITTQGRSRIKKEAKQKAAENMLNLLNESNDRRFQKLMESTKISERLMNMSIKPEDEVDIAGSMRKPLHKHDTPEAIKKSDMSSVAYLKEYQLREELEDLGIAYRITNLNNVTMVLKAKLMGGHRSYTFLATGDDRKQVCLELLRKAVFAIRILND